MRKTDFILAMVLAAMTVSCSNNKQEEGKDGKLQQTPQVNEVEVITLKKEDFTRQLLSNGRLQAAKKASLVFGSTGKISAVNVKNGQYVSKGARIATLDRPDLRLSLESAQTEVQKAELELKDYLAGQGYRASDTTSVPKELMATAKMKSGLTAARNSLERARYDMAGTVLTAPISGVVADLKLHQFDQYSGSDPFCTVVDNSVFDVDFTVMESEYSFLKPGLEVKVHPFADASKEYTGTVTGINPLVDTKGQISVRAQVRNDGTLIDGMNVKVVVSRPVKDRLVVPRSAVVIRDNMDVLFTYSEDGRAHWTYVNILDSNGDSYAVEANQDRNAHLEEGDQVIISGNLNLADESEVVLKKR